MGDLLISFLKFIIALVLSPVVWVVVDNSREYLKTYPQAYQDMFFAGAVIFLVVFLFFNRLYAVYDFGQKIIGTIFKFLAPLDRLFTNLFPFYFLVTLMFFVIFSKFLNLTQFNHQFMFMLSFTFLMHILNLAVELQEQEPAFIKPNYYLVMCLTVIIEMVIVIFILDLIFARSAVSVFISDVFNESKELYVALLKSFTRM